MLLPDFLREIGNERYTAMVNAEDPDQAIDQAKEEAVEAVEGTEREHFALLISFEGHPRVSRYGFQDF